MAKVIRIIRDIIISAVIVLCVTAGFFGAVLQESYKLAPLTAVEIMGE